MKGLRLGLSLASFLVAGFAGGLVVSGRQAGNLADPALPPDAGLAAATEQDNRPTVATPAGGLPDLSTAAERALKASVSIATTNTVALDPFTQFWTGERVQQSQGAGSGVIVSADGYILTNTHVIGSTDADIRVTLDDLREFQAKLIGIDEISDLAVIKIEATNLSTLPWGDSERLRVAEWVLAVGNPFQLSGTVTLGIVSKASRSGEQIGSYQDFIQTDAAINPGNSGGALINAQGELVGINTMIVAPTGGNQGIGLAIPAKAARQIMTLLIKDGVVSYGSIGAIDFFPITPQLAQRNNLNFTGAYVRAMYPTDPAYRAGLRPRDTVVAVNGQPVVTREQIDRVIIPLRVGSTVKLDVVKADGRRVTMDVLVGARQNQGQRRAR